ncbi:MAG TPA: HAMP domain-containing sensor histidine kinase [Candidatus Kapabacteria bacterium]|nr:HAMP domain-containing sensor histidine kinase [Candidatus Kapabacteria bacterium]
MTPKEEAIAAIDRARHEMEEVLQHLEQVPMFDSGNIAYAAHALQSYLTVINGTTELLNDRFKGFCDAEVERWLEGIVHTSQLMSHTVSQLMNTGVTAPSIKLVEIELPTLVQRACAYYRHLSGRKQIAILFRSGPDIPPVFADRVALAAALDNLLSNAVKYSLPGKVITVEVRPEGEMVQCRVQDEGPGISEADQGRLFKKGVRLSAVPTGGEASSGYGLAVARDLVLKIGGTLRCESKLGSGTCFIISLPAFSAAAKNTESFTLPVEWSTT